MFELRARAPFVSILSAVLLAGTAVTSLLALSAPVRATDTGSISGTVTGSGDPLQIICGKVVNAQTGASLKNICVNANSANGGGPGAGPGQQSFTQTASDGSYQLESLSSGAYDVDFNDCQGRSGSWLEQSWESAPNQ